MKEQKEDFIYFRQYIEKKRIKMLNKLYHGLKKGKY